MNTFSLERRHEPFDYVAQVSAAVHELVPSEDKFR